MTCLVKSSMSAIGFIAAFFVSVVSAQAIEGLPASASTVRNTVVAMSIADAALPAAAAASVSPSSVAMKPEISRALASMQPVARRPRANLYNVTYYDRRARPYHMHFPLILGIAY